MREQNKKKFGLSHRFTSSLTLPKARTKEWLKVLTIEQIFKRKSNFSVGEKLHFLSILQNALEKKLKTLEMLRERKKYFKKCNIGIVVERKLGKGIHDQYYEIVEFQQI